MVAVRRRQPLRQVAGVLHRPRPQRCLVRPWQFAQAETRASARNVAVAAARSRSLAARSLTGVPPAVRQGLPPGLPQGHGPLGLLRRCQRRRVRLPDPRQPSCRRLRPRQVVRIHQPPLLPHGVRRRMACQRPPRRVRRRLGACHRRPHPVAGAVQAAAAQGPVHRRQALLRLLTARATGSYT